VRIVLDTNVLIAALIARGTCHELLEHCVVRHELITSQFILDELREKLVEKFKYPNAMADEAITVLRSRMKVITPSPLEIPVCRDVDDDNVLAAAVDASCDCIVTGDKDLLVLHPYQAVAILTPRAFLAVEGAE
jgi:putative PIN family toxin of toxin-antitoxin system